MTAASDLNALSVCLPVLLGRAAVLARQSGGQSEGSPAERVQALLGAATRAMRKLATMRTGHYRCVLALLATYVYHGHTATLWALDLALALRNADAQRVALRSLANVRAGSGPDTHALTTEGAELIATAEQHYAEADETPSGGQWLEGDLAAVTLALSELVAHRSSVAVELAGERAAAKIPVDGPRRRCYLPDLCARQIHPTRKSGMMRWPSKCVGRDGVSAASGLGVPVGWVDRAVCGRGVRVCR